MDMNGYTLVDFYATWCGPCKMLSPIIDEIASDRADLNIVKVDVDDNHELAKKHGVMSIPTLILFKDGVEIAKHIGLLSKSELIEWINENKD